MIRPLAETKPSRKSGRFLICAYPSANRPANGDLRVMQQARDTLFQPMHRRINEMDAEQSANWGIFPHICTGFPHPAFCGKYENRL